MLPHFIADGLRRNPYPLYGAMRRFAPVFHVPRQGIWALFDHASVKRALDDPGTFSSRAAPPGGAPLDWIIFMDPPRHTALRGLVSRTFTPRNIASLEPRVEAIVHRLLDDMLPRGSADFVKDFAERLPTLVIMEMMGMPIADAPSVTRWGDAIMHLGDMIMGGEIAAKASAFYGVAKQEMQPYLAALLAERRSAPRDDLMTRLVQAEVDGQHLTDDEMFGFFQLLLLAGTETTTNLLANSLLLFLEHPAQLALLRKSPELMPAAIEEVLRFRTPVQMVFRATTQDVELRGRTIPPHQLVLVMVGSANRDSGHFRNPHRFDITRTPVPHVAFGHGAHFCMGAALARLEARIALTALLARTKDFRRTTSGAWTPRTGINLLGPRSLPIAFAPV